jgi:uncharacterized protein
MRCLQPASREFPVDAREVDVPGEGEELDSPYVTNDVVDVHRWVRDSFALELPTTLVCRDDCAGLCAECGANLNEDPDHRHETGPDPRWAKLSELKFD